MTDIVERLREAAKTGREGGLPDEAANEIERLREHDSYECGELEYQNIALTARIALLEKQNETLRAVLKGVVQADPCSLEALYAINAAKAALNGGTK